MTFKELLDKEISGSFKLKSPNTKTDHPWHLQHLHADFVELKCLFWSKNEWLTLQDVIGHYKDSNEKTDNEKSTTDEVGSDASDNDDRLLSNCIEIFQVNKDRVQYFSLDYPFEVDEANNYIKLKKDLTLKHLLYIKLLLASNLNNFPKLKSFLTTDFERISAKVLEIYFPNSIVKEFGQNSIYKGNTKTKIEALATDLNIESRKRELKKIPDNASKEKGVDIIAYIPFKDKITSIIILLAQCACGKDWPSKTNETTNYETYLDFYQLRPIHSMMIPYCISSELDNGFYQSQSLVNKLVFERRRMVEILTDLDFFQNLESYEIAKKVAEIEAVEV
jgi:hypothetical protein